VSLYKDFKRNPVFSHDYVIIQSVLEENVNLAIECSRALKEMRDGLERDLRGRSWTGGVYRDEQCAECKVFCYLGALKCPKHKVLCFQHECGCKDSSVELNWELKRLEEMQIRIDSLANSVCGWIKEYNRNCEFAVQTMAIVIDKASRIGYTGPEVAALEKKLVKCLDWEKSVKVLFEATEKKYLSDFDYLIEIGMALDFSSPYMEELSAISQSATGYNDSVLKQIPACNMDQKKLDMLLKAVSEYHVALPCLGKVNYALEKSKFEQTYHHVEDFENYPWEKVEELYQTAIDFNLDILSSRLSVSILRGQSLARRIEAYVSSEQVVDFSILDNLFKERIGVPIPSTAHALFDWLLGAKKWCFRAQKVLTPVNQEDRRTQEFEADVLAKEYSEYFSKLYLREALILHEELQKTELWKESISLLLVGQKTISFPECIKYLKNTIMRASNNDPGENPCICKSKMGYVMVQCIDCQHYYHRHCLRIPKDFDPERFQCPVCDINVGYNPFQKPSFQSFSALVSDSTHLTIFPEFGEEFQSLVFLLDKFLMGIDDAIDVCTNIWDARDLLRRLYGLFVITNQTVRLEVSLYLPKCTICDGKDHPESMLKCIKCPRFVHTHCANNTVYFPSHFQCTLCERKRCISGTSSLNIVPKYK
jgi:PLU-1-like protein/C5HC2 zinc finger